MNDQSLKPKQKMGLINQVVDGESLILNNQGAEIHQLNNVASLIWKNCDGEKSIEDISSILLENYEVSYDNAFSDVTLVVDQLREKGLLE